MKILIVDNNIQFRKGLKTFIEKHLKYTVVGEASNGKEFLDMLTGDIDMVLMDINMPEINGIKAAKLGVWNYSHINIIALSQYQESLDLKLLIGAGFKGFVSKTNIASDLDTIIRNVQKGLFSFPDDLKIY